MFRFRKSCVSSAAIAVVLVVTAYGQRLEAQSSSNSNLESEVAAIKKENAALKEQLRQVQEQQKELLELVRSLQQQSSPIPPTAAASSPDPQLKTVFSKGGTPLATDDSAAVMQAPVQSNSISSTKTSSDEDQDQPGRTYDEDAQGLLLAKSRPDAKIPFRLSLWDTTQIRFTNNVLGNKNFTDHLGAVLPVVVRNDFSLNRNLFHFNGYIFDERMRYNLIIWTSNSTASIVVGGSVSWQFSKALSVYGGYWGAPGSRTLAGTFPYFATIDRSMADNFFRPSFTQGVWIDGEPGKGLYYMVFVGDGLNTLTIPLSNISTGLVTSGTIAWEPLGPYGPRGRARGSYDDYENHQKPVIRLGTAFTRSRENRFGNLEEQGDPENNALFNSDGVNTFATGAFAPGVTLTDLTYRMWAADAGVKWHGFSANGQYFLRWLGSFVADGPLPLSSTFDHGGEIVLSDYVVPKKFDVYARTSFVFGQFRNSNEYGLGIKWYPLKTYRVWLSGEGLRINRSPVGSTIGSYSAGFSGWQPQAQFMFTF